MLDLQYRIDLLARLGDYLLHPGDEWNATIEKARQRNLWFTTGFIQLASAAIGHRFLQKDVLRHWAASYAIPSRQEHPKTVGIVMAGNIPLVGFHDWLAVFVAGHNSRVKLSSKDAVLLPFLVHLLEQWEPAISGQTAFAEQLKGCDAYIATGSDNTARYFDYYFGKYPSIIRKNRTSVAVLTGNETAEELDRLADDTHLYFGLGCRNVTALRVPVGYNFEPLLQAFRKYSAFFDHAKYKNNYDYQLAIALLNNQYYMTNGSVLLLENPGLFSPIAQLNYSFYQPGEDPAAALAGNNSVQCIVGQGNIPFGKAQEPAIDDYADGVDTMAFLAYL